MEPETGIYTAVTVRPGAGAGHYEATVALDLLDQDEQATGLQVYSDAAYSSGDAVAALLARGHRLFLKPAPVNTAISGGFSLDDFLIDTANGLVTCPAGHTVTLTPPAGIHHQRRAVFEQVGTGCPLRERRTTAKRGRVLTIRPHHDQQAAIRRQAATDPDRQAAYRRWRPLVERAVAWLITGGNRRLRHRGTIPNNTWIHNRAAALNLRTLINFALYRDNGQWSLPTTT